MNSFLFFKRSYKKEPINQLNLLRIKMKSWLWMDCLNNQVHKIELAESKKNFYRM